MILTNNPPIHSPHQIFMHSINGNIPNHPSDYQSLYSGEYLNSMKNDNMAKTQNQSPHQFNRNKTDALNMSLMTVNNRPVSTESIINSQGAQMMSPVTSSHLQHALFNPHQSTSQNIIFNPQSGALIPNEHNIRLNQLPSPLSLNPQIMQSFAASDWSASPLLNNGPNQYLTQQHNLMKNNFMNLPVDPSLQLTPLVLLPNKNGKDNSAAIYSRDIIISNDLIGCIIGKGGCTINGIRKLSTASIKIGNLEEGSKDRRITVTGNLESVTSTIMTINSILETHKQIWQLNIQLASTMTAAMTSQDSTNMNLALAACVQDARTPNIPCLQATQVAYPQANSQMTNFFNQTGSLMPFPATGLINQNPNQQIPLSNILSNQQQQNPSANEQMYKIKSSKVNCVKYEPY